MLNFKEYENDVSQFVACNTNVEYVVIEAEVPVVDETPEENNGDIPDAEADNNEVEKKAEDEPEQPEQDAVGEESQEIENANNEEQQNDNNPDTVSQIVIKNLQFMEVALMFLKKIIKLFSLRSALFRN